jgi:hypothetical protein
MAMADLVLVAGEAGDEREVRRLIPEAIALAERLGIPTILSVVYHSAGLALGQLGVRRQARVMFDRGLVHADAGGPITAVTHRVHYALIVDDPNDAARIIRPVFPIVREQLTGFYLLEPVLVAAKIAAGSGRERVAARLLGAAHLPTWAGHYVLFPEYERVVSQVRTMLGDSTFEEESQLGTQLSTDDALQLAEEVVAATG